MKNTQVQMHHYRVEDAQRYGLEEAILLDHFRFWIATNRMNKINFFEGKYWTYNTANTYHEIYPFFSVKRIRAILESLVEQEVLIRAHHSEDKRDRTYWYAFSEVFDDFLKIEPSSSETGNPHVPDLEHVYNKETPTNTTTNSSINEDDLFPDTKAKRKTKSQPMTIEEWEKVHGQFDIKMLAAWGREKNLDAMKILPKVEEYRLQWKAKGYKYANFVAAFQQWINRDGVEKYKKTTQQDANSPGRIVEGNQL